MSYPNSKANFMGNENELEISKALLNVSSQLTKVIEQNNAALLKQNSELKNSKKFQQDITESTQEMFKSYKSNNGLVSNLSRSLKEMGSNVLNMSTGFLSLKGALTIGNAIKDFVELDDTMTKVSFQMGKGKQGIDGLKQSVNELSKDYGTSFKNALAYTKELAQAKYDGNIKEAAAGVDLFSRATDVAADSVLQLTNNLSKEAGLDDKQINGIYATMVKVQQEVGISNQGMTALVSTVNDVSTSLSSLGKTPAQIKKMTQETTLFVASLEKVGISAQKSTELLDKLMDPDRIEDNILLYSQLGISINDAMSGDFDIMGSMGPQLKDLAAKIVEMGPIAGSQFGKQMGISFKDASKMLKADFNPEGLENATKGIEEQGLEALKALTEQTMGIGEKMDSIFNKIEGHIRSLGKYAMILIPLVFSLLKSSVESFGKSFFKTIQASVSTGLDSGVNDGLVKTKKALGSSLLAGSQKDQDKKSFLGKTNKVIAKKDKKDADIKNIADQIKEAREASLQNISEIENAAQKAGVNISKAFESKEELEAFRNGTMSAASAQAALEKAIKESSLQGKDAARVKKELSKEYKYNSDIIEGLSAASKEAAESFVKLKDSEKSVQQVFGEDFNIESLAESLDITSSIQEIQESLAKNNTELADLEAKKAELIASQKENQELLKSQTQEVLELSEALTNEERAKYGATNLSKESLEKIISKMQKGEELNESELKVKKLIVDTQTDLNNSIFTTIENTKKIGNALDENKEKLSDTVKEQKRLNTEMTKAEMKSNFKANKETDSGLLNTLKGLFKKDSSSKSKKKIKGVLESAEFGKKIDGITSITSKLPGLLGTISTSVLRFLPKLAGIGKIAGVFLKFAGPIGLIVSGIIIVSKMVKKVSDKFEKLFGVVGNTFKKVFQPIKDFFDKMNTAGGNGLFSMIKKLVGFLVPTILYTVGAILKVVSWITTPFKWILQLLGEIPFIGGVFKGAAEGLETLNTTANACFEAASGFGDDVENALADNREQEQKAADEKENKSEPEVIIAKEGEFRVQQDAVGNSTENNSTTNTVAKTEATSVVQKVEEVKKEEEDPIEKIKAQEKEVAEYKHKSFLENSLAQLVKLQSELLSVLSEGLDNNSLEKILASPAEEMVLGAAGEKTGNV